MSATLPVIKKSASALKLAAIICVVQALLAPLALVLILLGLKTDFVGLMLMSYYFTAYPAELLQWTGLPIRDGSFNLPTTIAFFSGLIIWFIVYFILAAAFITFARKRHATQSAPRLE